MSGNRLRAAWERIWFEPEPAVTLVAARWLVFTVLAVDIWMRRSSYRGIPGRSSELWDPISLLGLVALAQPSAPVIEGLLWITWLAAGATLLLRRAPRATALVAATAGSALVMMDNSFGKIDHDQQVLVIMAAVIALAIAPRLGDPDSWRHRWPVQLCRTAFGVMLLAAAVSKLHASGFEWIFSSNLRNILVVENLLLREPALQEFALWIASEPWRWQGVAAASIVGEFALILAVLARHPLVRIPAVAAGIATVVGITLLMGLVGFPIVALAAIFVAVDRLVVARRSGARIWPSSLLPAAGITVLAATLLIHPVAIISPGERLALLLPLVAATGVVVLVLMRIRGPRPSGA